MRARLYAKPAPTERTVERVAPVEPVERRAPVERVAEAERIADRPAA